MSISNVQGLYANIPAHEKERLNRPFAELARELAQETRTVVGVLRDSVFEGLQTPSGLSAEQIERVWGERDDVRVVRLDVNQIRSHAILFLGKLDILVLPYGGIYPMENPGVFSGMAFHRFLAAGGAVLTTGGVPFSKQAEPDGTICHESGTRFPVREAYDRWIAGFGVKYYQSRNMPDTAGVDADLLPSLADAEVMASDIGIVLNNSAHHPQPHPPHGNVFPERCPVRQILPLTWSADRFGCRLATTGLLAQDFETGSRLMCFSHDGEPHPLSPESGRFEAVMADVLALLSNRVMVRDVRTNYACYREGEPVQVSAELRSFESAAVEVELRAEIRGAGRTCWQQAETLGIAPGETLTRSWQWEAEHFAADEYELRVTLLRDGRVVSRGDNGFVIWNDDVARSGEDLAIEGQYFRLADGGSFISGTNYYESTRGELMWFRPNVLRLIEDHRAMRDNGVNYIRPHYHHLKWFKDYLLYHYDRLPDYFAELEGVESPLPDETRLRIFDAFIYLARKYGIIYGGDLLTLVPQEMGDPRGWFGTTETFYCKELLKTQREFLAMIDNRYAGVPGISWDLFNEPHRIPDEVVNIWARELRPAIDENRTNRLLTVGGPMHMGDAVEYDSPHGRIPADFINRGGRPSLLQELHIDRAEGLAEDLAQAEDLRWFFFLTIRNGLAGIVPWSWCRQMRLWQDGIPMEKWDDRLGMHVYDDGVLKPAGMVFADMAAVMRAIRLRWFDPESMRLVSDAGEVIVTLDEDPDRPTGHSLHHVVDGQCICGVARSRVTWEGRTLAQGPETAYVYLLSPDGAKMNETDVLLTKCDAPGQLTVSAREGGPKTVQLVRLAPGLCERLCDLEWKRQERGVTVNVEPNMETYWVRMTW